MEQSNETRPWSERLSFLNDEEMNQVIDDISESIGRYLDERNSVPMDHQENDRVALATWRDRNPDSPIRKLRSIRRTSEYQEILRGIESEIESRHPEIVAMREREHAILHDADGIDAVMATLDTLGIPEGSLEDCGLSEDITGILLAHASDIMNDERLRRLAGDMSERISQVLLCGDLEEYSYEDDYDKPLWWGAKKHSEIKDIDDLLRWISLPEWSFGIEVPPIVSQILGEDDLSDDMTFQAIDEALQSSPEMTAMRELSETLHGDHAYMHDDNWLYEDDVVDWKMDRRDELILLVHQSFDEDSVIALVRRNPRYSDMFAELDRRMERERQIVESIVETIPENPIDLYPLARSMERHFVLHIGPTNSGKTHDAIECLGKAPSGVYLAPLRLLAYEQYERLNGSGCPCSLLTGEEEMPVAGARHRSSTIEMIDLSTPIDVAVIDEAQMIADRDRGSHWTEAILGVPAREVHVCLAPEATDIVRKLVDICGDGCEVVMHERMSPLEQEAGAFAFPKDVRRGDAIIVFTRRAVHAVAAEVTRAGMSASMIYGSLPYDVRHREAERFASGETDVVVATDAIGMGMNLPIRRVVLLEQAKFDGHEKRLLTGTEIRQISGRAGRYGIHEKGLWRSANEGKKLGRLASAKPTQISVAPIGFVRTLLGVEGTVSQLMEKWVSIGTIPPFSKTDMERERELSEMLEGMISDEQAESPEGKSLVYRFATMPFKENIDGLLRLWAKMFKSEMEGNPFPVRVPSGSLPNDMEGLEAAYAHADLLHQYCRTFGHTEHYEAIDCRRREISERLSRMISDSVFEPRRCRECRKPLPWNWPYPMCDPCHDRLYLRRHWG